MREGAVEIEPVLATNLANSVPMFPLIKDEPFTITE
jgi:hypothetical protein